MSGRSARRPRQAFPPADIRTGVARRAQPQSISPRAGDPNVQRLSHPFAPWRGEPPPRQYRLILTAGMSAPTFG
ncbi:hypothetical protein LWS81_22865 [Enterobacter kobei]|nr:hypothetical protein [Enterobacter kobei]MCE1264977.1 hypothetical protein [Enterobacter kobei]